MRLMSHRPYPVEENRGVMLELERRWNEIHGNPETKENVMSCPGGS